MRIYISGPMTGHPDHNIHAFNASALLLREQGHFVINPAELSALFAPSHELQMAFEGTNRTWGSIEYWNKLRNSVMSADLAAVRSCDAIYLLHGWEESRGAKKELAEAIAHGLKVVQEGGEA